jgi:magnesium transporter
MSEYGTKVGLPPGTIVHTGPKRVDSMTLRIVDYSENEISAQPNPTIDECVPLDKKGFTRWIDINGVHEVDKIEAIGKNFNIHPLVIEDISSTQQRPKADIMENGVHIVLRAFNYDEGTRLVYSEQITIIMGDKFVLSFQESADDIFEPILKRLEQIGSRIRKSHSDYLTYALVDLIVDRYFIVLEVLGDKIEEIEDALIQSPSPEMLGKIYSLKRNIVHLRKYIWPLREVVFRLNRDEATLIRRETDIFLRDLYDHVVRATDHIETYRDSLTSMLDIYLTSISNRMNEVMKVLTVMSTIFIPLTLIVGIYGMNLEIPEYHWEYAYPVLLVVMLAIAILLLAYFRRIKWI